MASTSRLRAAASLLATVCALLLSWELLGRSGVYPPHLFPPPSRVAFALSEMLRSGELAADLAASLRRLASGFVLGGLAGVAAGSLTGRVRTLGESAGQALHFLRTMPSLALIPLAMLWFGIGEAEKTAVVAWGAFFPVWLATHSGVAGVERELIWTARSLGVRGPRLYLEVLLPAALPLIVTGARVALATGTGAMAAAEATGAFEGVTHRIFYSHQMFQTEKMMAAMAVLAALGFLLDRLFVGAARLLFPWWRADA